MVAENAVPGNPLAAGAALGRYEIRRPLGRGGMGFVYEGIHRDLKKRVAIKVLSAELAANQEAKLRFLQEGEAASRIRHPHVVDVTDVGSDGPLTYLVMEFLEGEDLARRLTRGPLSVTEAVDVMIPVLAGVNAAHEVGVIHRDLKPANIYLSYGAHGTAAHPKVLDFGVSKVIGDGSVGGLTSTSASFGTPFYMPPEQLRGARQADQKSDQYALGVVLFECVTGRRPFQADNIYAMVRAIGDGDYRPPRTYRPDLPVGLEAAIMRAMHLDPAARFPSLHAYGAALLPFASTTARLLWKDTFGAAEAISSRSIPRNVRDAGGRPPTNTGLRAPTLIADPGPMASGFAPGGGTEYGQSINIDLRGPRRRWGMLAVVGLAAAGAVAAGVFFLDGGRPAPHARSHPSRPETSEAPVAPPKEAPPQPASPAPAEEAPADEQYRVEVTTEPTEATLELDGRARGSGSLRVDLKKDGRPHVLIARAPGYRDAVVEFTDHAPPPQLSLEPAPPPQTSSISRSRSVAPQPSAAAGGRLRFKRPHASRPRDYGGEGFARPAPVPSSGNGAPVLE